MKTKFRFFTIADYEKEEKFLRDMANKGFHFEKITFPGFYKFSESTPKDTIYRIDYGNHNTDDNKEYIQIFKDYGWTYMFDFFDWSYFKTDASNPNIEIFSDNESRLELAKKVFKNRYLVTLIIFILIVLPNFIGSLKGEHLGEYFTALVPIWIFLFLVYIIMLTYTGYGLYKLSKKYKDQ